jgi:hypothetical protein
MSAIDNARILVQDVVVPDLKAFTAKVDALEKSILKALDIDTRLGNLEAQRPKRDEMHA